MVDRNATGNVTVYPSTGGGCVRCGMRTRYGWLCDPCLGDEIEATELNAHFAEVQFEWDGKDGED